MQERCVLFLQVLLVEDEVVFLQSMKQDLEENGFSVDAVTTGADALEVVSYTDYDIVVLDVNLPDYLGFDLCAEIQENTEKHVPIIMATARDEVSDKIRGLENGADDYIVKPFSFDELRARMHAIIRRTHGKQVHDLSFGDVEIIPSLFQVKIHGKEVFFRAKEYEILYYLALHMPEPQSIESIIEHVWDDEVNPFSNAARVHIMSIRKKLSEHSQNVTIENIMKKGYYLCVH